MADSEKADSPTLMSAVILFSDDGRHLEAQFGLQLGIFEWMDRQTDPILTVIRLGLPLQQFRRRLLDNIQRTPGFVRGTTPSGEIDLPSEGSILPDFHEP